MNVLFEDIDKYMVPIPAGTEHLRDYRDDQKWISSNSKMSVPGQKGNLSEIQSVVDICAFSLAQYPVTKYVYHEIVEKVTLDTEDASTPMVNVSWFDAILFCNLLSKKYGLNECYILETNGIDVIWDKSADGYRLPTDAEWQYACRAGSTGYRYGPIDEIAWYKDNSYGKIHPVELKAPNSWGLNDMLGNVWEWCWDLYDEQTYGPYRIFRGGSWAETARGCGATSRRRGHPSFRIDDLGFRVARSI